MKNIRVQYRSNMIGLVWVLYGIHVAGTILYLWKLHQTIKVDRNYPGSYWWPYTITNLDLLAINGPRQHPLTLEIK